LNSSEFSKLIENLKLQFLPKVNAAMFKILWSIEELFLDNSLFLELILVE
jgi:hypothetical protein